NHDILKDPIAVREKIGYLAENSPLYGEMTVFDFLVFICRLRGLPEPRKAIDRAVELCAIKSVYYQTIETLSKGYKRRVGLAQAIIHDPEVLILDEPTDGLDPNQKHDVRELISSMAANKCIILSTHILEEVDAVCTRAMVISKGQLKADGKPDELRLQSPDQGALRIVLAEKVGESLSDKFKGIPGVTEVFEEVPCQQYMMYAQMDKNIKDVVQQSLQDENIEIQSSKVLGGKLETFFRHITTN
ncbi:ABC transporter ATP-binding protein, partial [Planctomycetota bacterium]